MSETQADSISKSSVETTIQPLHQESATLRQQVLQKHELPKHALNVASPTDSLMSPCTAKLQAHKKKYYMKRKPPVMSLQNTLQSVQTEKE